MTRAATETSARTIIGEPEVVEDRGAQADAALTAAAIVAGMVAPEAGRRGHPPAAGARREHRRDALPR